jgi:hypothetical protein
VDGGQGGEVGVSFLRGLAVAAAHRSRDLRPGCATIPGRLDQRQFAALEFGAEVADAGEVKLAAARLHQMRSS